MSIFILKYSAHFVVLAYILAYFFNFYLGNLKRVVAKKPIYLSFNWMYIFTLKIGSIFFFRVLRHIKKKYFLSFLGCIVPKYCDSIGSNNFVPRSNSGNNRSVQTLVQLKPSYRRQSLLQRICSTKEVPKDLGYVLRPLGMSFYVSTCFMRFKVVTYHMYK